MLVFLLNNYAEISKKDHESFIIELINLLIEKLNIQSEEIRDSKKNYEKIEKVKKYILELTEDNNDIRELVLEKFPNIFSDLKKN